MKQPVKGEKKPVKRRKSTRAKFNPYKSYGKPKNAKPYGTSKLELDFAKKFLEANGVRYVYQYEAVDIKRFFDFAIVDDENEYKTENKDGLVSIRQENQYIDVQFIIEIDGSYYHGDPRLLKEGQKLNSMQKHNKFIDTVKDKWAQSRCIPLLRIWEYDIRHNPSLVKEELSKYINLSKQKQKRKSHFQKPH